MHASVGRSALLARRTWTLQALAALLEERCRTGAPLHRAARAAAQGDARASGGKATLKLRFVAASRLFVLRRAMDHSLPSACNRAQRVQP